MANNHEQSTALGDIAARQLAIATRTVPQMGTITPRWLTHLLQWVPVEAGIYRVNRVKDASSVTVDCSGRDERELPQTFVDYIENPREYLLSAVNTVLDVHTRVSDLYSKPYNQISWCKRAWKPCGKGRRSSAWARLHRRRQPLRALLRHE